MTNRLSDDLLLRRLAELLRDARCVEADLIAHIAEVDARRLYAREASSSMYSYCIHTLHLSEAEAYLRIAVARASREHPILLEMMADGRLHLSGAAVLARHLTAENRDEVLRRASHRTKRQIEELVAGLAPQCDVPALIRKLPERKPAVNPTALLVPERVVEPAFVAAPLSASGASAALSGLLPERVPGASTPRLAQRARMEPLAAARYKVQFTASAELHEKLKRLQVLMSSTVPHGDLAAVIDAAVTEKLERLEARRFGKAKTPRKTLAKTDTAARARYIPAAVRRAVHERDGGRCAFVDALGRRCRARDRLEYDHHDRPYGRGGDHRPENIRLVCKTHNLLSAERDYGKARMDGYRRRAMTSEDRRSKPPSRPG